MADYDGDGDLDVFVEVGGAVPGDRANNLLFRNPGQGRHWLAVKLVGTRTNRAAIGRGIRVDFTTRSGRGDRCTGRWVRRRATGVARWWNTWGWGTRRSSRGSR